jgi:hypothetical protein
MKYLGIITLFFSLFLNSYCQTTVKVDWAFQKDPLLKKAMDKYKEQLLGKPSIFNFNVANQMPKIGIFLANVKLDSVNQTTNIDIWACYDESWKERNFDYFAFFDNLLILINRYSNNYPSCNELEALVQDRVYERQKVETRKVISPVSNPRNDLEYNEIDDGLYFINDSNHSTELRRGPYNLRHIIIDHKSGQIRII